MSASSPKESRPIGGLVRAGVDRIFARVNQLLIGRASEWIRLIAITGTTQIAVRGLGLLSGILIIRMLSVEQYALYTICNTMLGTMTILADGGISSGVMSEGGKVWKDPQRLSEVVQTGIWLRRRFVAISLMVTVPLLLVLLTQNGGSIGASILLTVSLLPVFIATITNRLLSVGPKLHQKIPALQRIEALSELGRCVTTCVSVLLAPLAPIVLLAAGIPKLWANTKLRRLNDEDASATVAKSEDVKERILTIVYRSLPSSIYFCLSSQISIWIVSILGATENVAGLGALARISVLFSVLMSIFASLVVPRFARLTGERSVIQRRFYVSLCLGVLSSVPINLVGWFAPGLLLGLLGDQYADLDMVLRWSLGLGTLTMLNQLASQMMSSRGLIVPPAKFIAFLFVLQVLSLSSQDLSTLEGVLIVGVLTALGSFLFRNLFFLRLSRQANVEDGDGSEQRDVA